MPAISEQRIRELAALAMSNPPRDLERFAACVRTAVQVYRTTMPAGMVRAELEALYRAADRRHHKIAARLIRQLSDAGRALLNRRGRHRTVKVEIPTPAELLDVEQRERACADIVRLIRVGGNRAPGRKRPGGKRSMSFVPTLNIPTTTMHPQLLAAERAAVFELELAFFYLTGRWPALSVNPRQLGPFARLVQQFLADVGSDASAVELLNAMHRENRMSGPDP